MLTKNKIKHIRQLHQKKYRKIFGEFVAEGNKIIHEILKSSIEIVSIIGTPEELVDIREYHDNIPEFLEVNKNEIKKISNLITPQGLMAVCKIPYHGLNKPEMYESLSLVLEDIRDPGNLGTIVRVADWFGINNIFCSGESVDIYNPKVIQASMGSFCRVKVHYEDLYPFITNIEFSTEFPLYAAVLDGENIFETDLRARGMILLGNESKGISHEILKLVSKKVKIPSFPESNSMDSLNLSIAGAIICAEFRKRSYSK